MAGLVRMARWTSEQTRLATQNVVGHKEFMTARQRAMGASVRKAGEGPKMSGQYELPTEKTRNPFAIPGHARRDSNTAWGLGQDLPCRGVASGLWG